MRVSLGDILARLSSKRRRKVTTVHFMFPLVAATFSIFGAAYLSGNSSYVQLTPTPAYVVAGEDVVISVEAVAVTPVNTINIEVVFPSQLKPISIDTGGTVITLWTSEPKIDGNKVTFSGGVFRKGFLGKHLIANVHAKAVASGEADVLVRNSVFLAGDGKGTPLALDTSDKTKAAVQIGMLGGKTTLAGTTLSGKVAVQIITDIDGNKVVDYRDIEAFMQAWRTGSAVYDFSGDGKMSFRDFAILLAAAFMK